jgi:MoxR-like ATPase
MSDALKRRCLHLWIDYPDEEVERKILEVKVPGMDAKLAADLVALMQKLRTLDLKKTPSISETIDWARTLLYFGKSDIDPEVIGETLHVLLKYQSDITKARKELQVPEVGGAV